MSENLEPVSRDQARYYGDLFDLHGPGVDAVASGQQVYKDVRYERVCRLIPDGTASLHDVGFGLGHFLEHLRSRTDELSTVEYSGSEVTPQFVEHCQRRYPGTAFHLRDLATEATDERYDCIVLTGTFYHRHDTSEDRFLEFMRVMLRNCFDMCQRGMVFNLISPFVDYRVGDLFYADLASVLTLVQGLSRFFAIDHSSPLYEYTIAVYSEDHVSAAHPDVAFDRYLPGRRDTA